MRKMIVIAGPAGKSTAFPLKSFGVDFFNADDRAAELNGSYRKIPTAIRSIVNVEFERFIDAHIERLESFAVETTLGSPTVFDQAARARDVGFITEMRYLALDTFDRHLQRVQARADAGGHSASESRLRVIHGASLANLNRAFREFDEFRAYDNSGAEPQLLVYAERGRVLFRNQPWPAWLWESVPQSE